MRIELAKRSRDAVEQFLEAFQAKLHKVDAKLLMKKLENDETLMREQANKTLLKVQKAVGLRV